MRFGSVCSGIGAVPVVSWIGKRIMMVVGHNDNKNPAQAILGSLAGIILVVA